MTASAPRWPAITIRIGFAIGLCLLVIVGWAFTLPTSSNNPALIRALTLMAVAAVSGAIALLVIVITAIRFGSLNSTDRAMGFATLLVPILAIIAMYT